MIAFYTFAIAGEYVVQDQGTYQFDKDLLIKAKMEAYSNNDINYIKVTVAKEDLNEDEFAYKFRCDGNILITTSLLKSVNLYQSTSFAYPKKLISYQRN